MWYNYNTLSVFILYSRRQQALAMKKEQDEREAELVRDNTYMEPLINVVSCTIRTLALDIIKEGLAYG